MAISSSAVWRVRKTGDNTNGGGYDVSISPAATGSNGSWSTSGTTCTFTDTTAAAFTAAMVGASINISGLGQMLILSYIDASHITISTPFFNKNSGSGSVYSWTVGAGIDYSQQDAAQATWAAGTNGLTCTGSASTTLTDGDARGLFTAAMVGNAIKIAGGTGFSTSASAGIFFITAYIDANNVTLDRTPASATTAASGATAKLGGAHADFWTNYSTRITGASNFCVVAGNAIYVRGYQTTVSTSPYTYDYTALADEIQYATAGSYSVISLLSGDPAGPGVPVIKLGGYNGVVFVGNTSYWRIAYLWLVQQSNPYSTWGAFYQNSNMVFDSMIFDQNGKDVPFCLDGNCVFINCELFSSQTVTVGNSAYILNMPGQGSCYATGCNIHDVCTNGVNVSGWGNSLTNSIVSNCINGVGINIVGYSTKGGYVQNCTVDGNKTGIQISLNAAVCSSIVINNIISNSTQYGLSIIGGTFDIQRAFVDYNVFYNNVQHRNNCGAAAHDTVISTSPYVGNSTDENYTLV